ncbi:hypothetical protein BDW59DRAFT_148387 [Aspergillus cavernicola]|uniref:Zinc finger GRF-type domain-containing protein n=1 Tax=Aspergillus cavernicola TaxID=176166 RepID=A0ABR4I7U3_9EURO
MSRDTLRSVFDKVRINGDGEFVCECGFPAKDYLVKKQGSPYYGSQFYACAKHFKDPGCCRTKIWFDEQNRVRDRIPPAMRVPRTPRKQVDIRIFGQYTPPTSSKRKAEIQSFDSGVGDMSDREPVSPSSRTPKRFKKDTVVTPEESTAMASDNRAMPRRRLFEEFLDPPGSVTKNNINPFSPPLPERRRTIISTPSSTSYARDVQPQSEKPVTPTKGTKTGLFTPQTGERHRHSHDEKDRPRTPTKSSSKTEQRTPPVDIDSDEESYGWEDELDGAILELANRVENPPYSPLFV